VVELVLNGADAYSSCGAGVVDVTIARRPAAHGVSRTSVEVTDRGTGMDLTTILSRLLVPFVTDKQAGVDVGRFGVGFFSVLGLACGGAHGDAGASVELSTGDGKTGWSLRVRPSRSGAAADLHCELSRIEPRRGTSVHLDGTCLPPDALRAYLRETLHFFPARRALLRVDGEPINDGSAVAGGRLFTDLASVGPPPLLARFHLGGKPLATGVATGSYHAGVKVESCLAISELALVDFPSAVELTEGRDALKPGPAFASVAAAFHRRLVRLAHRAQADRETCDRLAELAAQASALLFQSIGWPEAAPMLSRQLLGPDRFLVGPDRAEALLGFLGPRAAACLFVPESFWAEREWQHWMPTERDLLERELEVDPPETLASVAARRRDLAGLVNLLQRAPALRSVCLMLARGRHPGGSIPCLGTRRGVFVREDAPAVRSASSWSELYALRAAFTRASGVREPDFERDLIVNEPLGVGEFS
jgi:hypothetical protein